MDYSQAIKSAPIVLIEFYASWCPHCQRMMPIVAKAKEALAGKVTVYQYDIDDNQEDAKKAGVQSIPTFILFKNSTEIWRHVGEMEGNDLLNAVEAEIK